MKNKLPNGALTRHYGELARALHSFVSVRPSTDKIKEPEEFAGLWDTGATNTVITQAVVDKLGLVQTGIKVAYTPQGSHQTPSYLVDLVFPDSNLVFEDREVTLGKLANCDVLIGMDIIAYGDFAVTSKDGNTTMSFQVPSMQRIDYVTRARQTETRISKPQKKKKRK